MRLLMAVVMVLGVAFSGWTAEDPWVDECKADLDGDGTVEQISLVRLDRKPGAFTLSVDDAAITDRIVTYWPIDGLSVVDIRIGDGLREIAVHTRGGGEDPATWYFWYNGSELHRTGLVEGACSHGPYGDVYARQWTGHWMRTRVYSLRLLAHTLEQRAHQLDELPQDFYLVNRTWSVVHRHPIYRTRELQSVAGQMERGTRVTVVASDCKGRDDEWRYLVKLPDDTTGWLSGRQVRDNLGVPIAD